MALIDMESFAFSTSWQDFLTYNRFTGTTNGTSIVTVGGPLGDPYLSTAAATSISQNRLLSASFGTFFFGARVQAATVGTVQTGITFSDATAGANFNVSLNSSSGALVVARGGFGGTTIGTSPVGSFPLNSFFYLEIGTTISTTVGTVTLRVNGATVLTLTGVNNQNTAVASINQVRFNGNSGNVLNATHYYFCDSTGSSPTNTFLGDIRVIGIFPASNAAVQFTPNGLGANWQNAAKVPPVPLTDFNSDSTIGDTDLFNVTAVPASTTTVLGVQLSTLAYKSTAGNRSLASEISSSGTIANGATIGLSITPLEQKDLFPLDPNGNIAWSPTSLGSLEIGYKVAA